MNKSVTYPLIDLNHFPCGCLITTRDRKILFANQFFADTLGWEPEFLMGQSVDVLLKKPARIFCESFVVPEVFNHRRCSEVQIALASKTGKSFPKTASVQLMPDGNLSWVFLEADKRQRLFQQLEAAREALQDHREKLELLSRTDPLTGLANRRELDITTHRILVNAKRLGVPVSVMVLDIDKFKVINDRLGHAAGDQALCWLAEILKMTLRETDLIARLGGDEFVCVLNDTDSEQAIVLCDRINSFLQTTQSPTLSFTISMGVAVTTSPATTTFQELLKLADDALYEAKLAGRNTTRVAKPKVQ